MFKQIRNTAIAAIAASGMLATAAAAQAGTYFEVENASGMDIYYVYVSPDFSDNWGNDLLAEAILPTGGTMQVELNSYGDHCMYDMLVIWEDGYQQDSYGIDLCQYDSIVVE